MKTEIKYSQMDIDSNYTTEIEAIWRAKLLERYNPHALIVVEHSSVSENYFVWIRKGDD